MTVFSLFCHGLVIQSRKTCLERVYPGCTQGFWAAQTPPAPIGSPVPSSWPKLGGEGGNASGVLTAEPGHVAPELSLIARRTCNGGSAGPGRPAVRVGPAKPGPGQVPGEATRRGTVLVPAEGLLVRGQSLPLPLCGVEDILLPRPAVTRDTLLPPEVRRFNKSF